jgi:hypothetical protein
MQKEPCCHRGPRPAGVHWIPADQFKRVVDELQTNPCAAERFPFESMESLRDPAKHAEFMRTRVHPAPAYRR